MHEIKKWSSEYGGNPSLEAIQAMFLPPEKFRVSLAQIPRNHVFATSTFEGKVFVLHGSVTYSSPEMSLTLREGDFTFLPTGTYEVATDSKEDLEMVRVFNLDDLVKSKHV